MNKICGQRYLQRDTTYTVDNEQHNLKKCKSKLSKTFDNFFVELTLEISWGYVDAYNRLFLLPQTTCFHIFYESYYFVIIIVITIEHA